jgi:ankyrin repeat protein
VKRGFDETPTLSPLVQAVRAGDIEGTRILLDSGVDPDSERGGRGWTPLMHAIHEDQIELIRALIRGGANVNQSNGNGLTPLMLAAAYGQNATVTMLLKSGADLYQANTSGLRALDFAMLGADDVGNFTVFTCQTETVRILRERAPDLAPRGAWVDRALMFVKSCDY